MVWKATGYTTRPPILYVVGNLNSQGYLSQIIRPVARGLGDAIFQQDITRPNATHRVLTNLDILRVQLLPCPARSLDLLPIENIWSCVAEETVLLPLSNYDD